MRSAHSQNNYNRRRENRTERERDNALLRKSDGQLSPLAFSYKQKLVI